MSKDIVQDGLVVSMEYTLTVDGEMLDSSKDAGPCNSLQDTITLSPVSNAR